MVSNKTYIQRGPSFRIAFGITLLVLFVGVGFGHAETQMPLPPEINFSDSFQFPWRIEGNGTYFELNKSEYLNTTLYSSESIKLILESVPEMVTIHIESDSDATSTQITLGGFLPLTTYHKYEDNYHNHVAFTTDANGNYTYSQDLSHKHLVFIQPRPSTRFIIDDATGGDCTTFGTWDATIKTCTLTIDLTDTIQIDSDGITLDGNGYTITGLGDGSGVYLTGRTGVTVSNLNIKNFSYGIYLDTSSHNTISGNNVTNNSYGGIYLDFSSYNKVSGNNILNNSYGGIWLISSSYNTVNGNNISNHIFEGIYLHNSNNNLISANIGSNNGPVDYVGGIFVGDIILYGSSNNIVGSNNISNSNFGIFLGGANDINRYSINNTVSGNIVSNSLLGGIHVMFASNNIINDNTISNSSQLAAIMLGGSNNNIVRSNTFLNNRYGIFPGGNNVIYNNNFINNSIQSHCYDCETNIFNLEAPIGGNYWSDYDTPEEGCNNVNGDNFCDEPYVFTGGQDNLPWISPDGWLITPTGINVQINPSHNVSVNFSEVTREGSTTVTESSTNPRPDIADFIFLGSYYELSTTAEFTPPVTVCINYDDTDILPEIEAHLKIFRLNEGGTGWDDVTMPGYPDIENNIICGQVDSFSWFGIGYDSSLAGPLAYITFPDDDIVSVIDTWTHEVIATINVGDYPWDIAVNHAGTKVYVLNHGSYPDYSSTLSVIDTATNTVTATIYVNRGFQLAVNPEGTKVYVTSSSSPTISVIDTATNTVSETINTEGRRTLDLEVNPEGTKLYVISEDSSPSQSLEGGYGYLHKILVIDTATNTVISTVNVGYEFGNLPISLAMNPTGTRLYVGSIMSPEFIVIDTETNMVIDYLPLPTGEINRMAANPIGNRVYGVHTVNGGFSVIDTETNTVIANFRGRSTPIWYAPIGVAVNPEGTRVYVTSRYENNNILVIDAATNTVIDIISLEIQPGHLVVFSINPSNTPAGNNIQTNPNSNVSIIFDEVTTAGDTTVTESTTNPGPDKDDFMFLGNYYEISTSALFTPPVTVCINYDDTGMPLEREAHLKIFHWTEGGTGWDDVTLPGYPDTDNNIICGQVNSFSWFGVGYDNSRPIVSSINGISDPVKVNTNVFLNATIDDTANGSSDIKSAEYSIDGAPWIPMSAVDGVFDESVEEVRATFFVSEPGVYNLCIRGIDVIDNTGQEKCSFLVVYDPTGGFVTGGGWIISNAGAYTTDTSLEGRANFGFVSKYQKGANIPTGQTEFQFKAGSLNFHSTVYQWLVVAGAKAQFKGSGTINGTGDYGFLLTATDGQLPGGGGVDKFRIKIVDKATGTIVYDNVPDKLDDIDTADPQEIGGGSIVIHK